MFDRQFRLFINTFADWVAGLGTVAAVVVALYLARLDHRINLTIVAALRLMLIPGSPERPEYPCLEVTNMGRRPARLTARTAAG